NTAICTVPQAFEDGVSMAYPCRKLPHTETHHTGKARGAPAVHGCSGALLSAPLGSKSLHRRIRQWYGINPRIISGRTGEREVPPPFAGLSDLSRGLVQLQGDPRALPVSFP